MFERLKFWKKEEPVKYSPVYDVLTQWWQVDTVLDNAFIEFGIVLVPQDPDKVVWMPETVSNLNGRALKAAYAGCFIRAMTVDGVSRMSRWMDVIQEKGKEDGFI